MAADATIGPQSTPFAADAASSCSKPLLDAALADALLGLALRGLAVRVAMNLGGPEVGGV